MIEYFISFLFMQISRYTPEVSYHLSVGTFARSTKMWRLSLFALCLISRMDLRVTARQQCKPAEASVNGKALRGHTFKTSEVRSLFECQVLCENELKCQSYNYFITSKLCELNNRTKEARPNSFVPDESSFYMKSWPNRGTTLKI